jgi:23S rRNA pseudouridine1911/1915/1917 synthase
MEYAMRPTKKDPRKIRDSKQQRNRIPPRDPRRRPQFSRELSVLYEDDAVIVLDKPAGLLAVPIPGSNTPSALSLLTKELEWKRQRPFIVHRIDRFTSGALLFAKNGRDRDPLIKQFLAHTPVRQYLAVVRGRIENKSGTLVHHFRKEGPVQQLRTARDSRATRAELSYTVEQAFAEATLVRVDLLTGLQNQIRAQFAADGHPLIGDRKYNPAEASEKLISRVALHAAHLEFIHPRTGKKISVDAKQPSDFQHLIQELSRSSRPRPSGTKTRSNKGR